MLHRRRPSPDYSWVGSCIISFEACSAFTRVTTCRLARSPYAPLYTEGSGGFVASTAAPIATGWSDPVPGRVLPPAVDQRLSRRTAIAWLRQLSVNSRRRGRNFPSYCNFVCTPLGLPSEECSGEIGRDIVFFGSNCPARTLKLRCAEGFFLR